MIEVLDGPKTISLAVRRENPTYTLNVLGLIPGYQYDFKVSLISLYMCINMFHYGCVQVRGRTKVGYGSNSSATIVLECPGDLNPIHTITLC